jgi:hypothetical protein
MQSLKTLVAKYEESVLSTSPYKISFFNMKGSYRPEKYDLIELYKIISKKKDIYLNEMMLDDTPVKLIFDIDRVKTSDIKIKDYENNIKKFLTDHINWFFTDVSELLKLEFMYNRVNGNCRVYTNINMLSKYRSKFCELLNNKKPEVLKDYITIDNKNMMRSVYSKKPRSKTEKELSLYSDENDREKESKKKVPDENCGTYWPGVERSKTYFDNLIKYSVFLLYDEPLTPIHQQEWIDKWELEIEAENLKKEMNKLPNEQRLENIKNMKQLDNNKIDQLLNYLDSDTNGNIWRGLVQSLYNLGATKKQIHEWSKYSSQYDSKAKDDIDRLENINNRYPYGLSHIKKALTTEDIAKCSNIFKKLEQTEIKPFIKSEEPLGKISLKFYEEVKIEFEKTHMKCINKGYYEINDTINIRNEKSLKESYRHMRCWIKCKKSLAEMEHENEYYKEDSFINKWIIDINIRKYDNVAMYPPPLKCPNNHFNLWDGFEIEKSIHNIDNELTKLIYKHIKMLSGNNEEIYQYTLNWIAHMLQKPGNIPNIMILFKSLQGLGKDLLFTFLEKIIGKKLCWRTQSVERDIFGSFNHHLENKLFICMNEIDIKIFKKYESSIKDLITSTEITVNQKGVDTRHVPTYFHLFAFQQGDYHVVDDDRRYQIIDASVIEVPDHNYFNQLIELINNKNVQYTFFNDMMNRNISNWKSKEDRVSTEYITNLKEESRDPILNYIIHLYYAHENSVSLEYTSDELFNQFASFVESEYNKTDREKLKKTTSMRKLCSFNIDGVEEKRTSKIRGYKITICKLRDWLKLKKLI